MEKINLPLLFARDKQESLNNALYNKTGCFMFLKTDEILPGFVPTSYADAFLEVVIGLYIVYHDLACSYWKALLSIDFCPPTGFDKFKLNKPYKHVKCIIEALRPQFTHGFMLARDSQVDELRDALEILYDRNDSQLLPWGNSKTQWPRYMQMMTEAYWKQIVENLTRDSNDLYSVMLEWADSWEKAIADGATSPRHDFIWSDAFSKSIDLRVLNPYCRKHRVKRPEEEKLSELQNHLRDFYENNQHKKPDRILKELESWLKTENQGESSLDIAAKYGFSL